MRALVKAVLMIAVLYACILGAALVVMYQPPERFGSIMAHVPDVAFAIIPFRPLWFMARAGRLQEGDPAPAFALPVPDKTKILQLASLRGPRPVVLVFGSYT
jgi:hypothetical protein